MEIVINGQGRSFPELAATPTLQALIETLSLKGDRVAVEHNGNIVPRPLWTGTLVRTGDRLEIVHFVGGGSIPLFNPAGRHLAP